MSEEQLAKRSQNQKIMKWRKSKFKKTQRDETRGMNSAQTMGNSRETSWGVALAWKRSRSKNNKKQPNNIHVNNKYINNNVQ